MQVYTKGRFDTINLTSVVFPFGGKMIKVGIPAVIYALTD